MRGLTSTIVLLLVLAGLGAYIYFVDSGRPQGGGDVKSKVFSVEGDRLEEITVTAEGDTTTVRKSDGTWKVVAPLSADADSVEVSSLTSALAGLEVNRVVEENASDLGAYGLADPRLKVAFKAEGGAAGEIHLGDTTPTGSDMYAITPGGSRVFLVSAYQETSLSKSTFDLRDKRVLHFERDQVATIELAQPGAPVVRLARNGTEWTLTAPIKARGDYGAIEGLLTRLATGTMTELVDPNSPESFGLEKPLVVSVGAGSNQAVLELGAERDGAVYARDRGRQMIFKADASLAADLRKGVDDLRDKDLFEFRTFNIMRLQITRGADTYEFQRIAGGGENGADKWQRVVDGKATDVDTTKVEDFVSKLGALRAESFNPTTNAARLAQPALVVSASYDTDKFERARIITGQDQAFGARDDEPGVAILDGADVEETIKALEEVLKS